MLCLSGFELYSRWVPLTVKQLPTDALSQINNIMDILDTVKIG